MLVSASWVETCTGLNVMYATFSPAIKTSLGYNQTQISRLGVAKDFGNAAEIIAGCLSQVISTRGLLFLGGFQFLLGYGLLWLIVVNKIADPPFWTVFILIFIGANAQKYLDMAAVVSCLPSFPDSRGSLLGVLKAFKGLSGAIFSHIYSTFFSPLQSAALLIVAIGPALVAFITSPIVRPVGRAYADDKRTEGIMYTISYIICFIIAGYMVFLLFFQGDLPAGDYRSILMISTLLALILSPLVPTLIHATVLSKKTSSTIEVGLNEALLQGNSGEPRILVQGLEDNAEAQSKEKPTTSISEPPVIRSIPFWRSGGEVPQLGEELTLLQALRTVEFWLLFFALYCGLGSGSTALDNLGQMAEAQGYENTQTFVSIFSISSYLGHLVGGYMSEVVVRSGIPRPASLVIVEGIMLLGQFLFAMAWTGSLYFASICLGLSYGSFSSINPAISSEIFGLKSFGPIFGLLTLSAPASSTVLAGFVAGTLYDREAEKQGSSDCTGQVCFYLTCWIMVGVCAVGMALSAALSWRVRGVYKKKAEKRVS